MAKKKTEDDGEEPPFEQAMENLETIVRRLEHGGGSLDAALEDYAKAIGLLKNCHARLEQAQRKVEILSGLDADGNPISETMERVESSLEEKQELRSERRSAANSPSRQRASESKATPRPADQQEGLF